MKAAIFIRLVESNGAISGRVAMVNPAIPKSYTFKTAKLSNGLTYRSSWMLHFQTPRTSDLTCRQATSTRLPRAMDRGRAERSSAFMASCVETGIIASRRTLTCSPRLSARSVRAF